MQKYYHQEPAALFILLSQLLLLLQMWVERLFFIENPASFSSENAWPPSSLLAEVCLN